KTKGDFFSNNTPWDSLLREVDTRYGLQTMFVKGHMYVLTQHDIVIAETPKTPPVRTQDDAIYDAVEAKFEKQYPELNPQSSNFNEVLVNKIKKRILEFRRRNPDATASEALSFAVLNTMSK
ncbi:MAG: hypothetical protein KGJ96_09445, partial [Xanthomonadaceae bacterium]|nr:hypothetical protein [Xanthomonadaceae bacterium]